MATVFVDFLSGALGLSACCRLESDVLDFLFAAGGSSFESGLLRFVGRLGFGAGFEGFLVRDNCDDSRPGLLGIFRAFAGDVVLSAGASLSESTMYSALRAETFSFDRPFLDSAVDLLVDPSAFDDCFSPAIFRSFSADV